MKIRDWHKANQSYFNQSELNFIFQSFGVSSLAQLLAEDQSLDQQQLRKLNLILSNQEKGIPLAFSLGQEGFFGSIFKVSPETLVPRSETEILVEKAGEIIAAEGSKTILDLCSGCGNIGISLGKLFPGKLDIYLSDQSRGALRVAKENSDNLGVEVKIVYSDLFASFKPLSFDLIVTNPPYVESRNIQGGLCYEPKAALDGGKDGLFLIKKIVNQAHNYLKDGGYLLIELGYRQKQKVEKFTKDSGFYKIKEWLKDYAGIWRGVVLEKRR